MSFSLRPGPLEMRPWMLREVATSARGASPLARMIRADLAFIGAPEVADMGSVDDADPRWDAPLAAYRRILTDRSPEATTRIRRHLMTHEGMEGHLYDTVMVDPVVANVAGRLGNSVAGLVMVTRSHEDMALHWADGPDEADDTVAIDIVDVEWRDEVRPFLTIAFEISDGVQLEAGRLEILSQVPETVGAALPGMPLSRFISHPLLDPFEVRIRSFDGLSLHLDYDELAAPALG